MVVGSDRDPQLEALSPSFWMLHVPLREVCGKSPFFGVLAKKLAKPFPALLQKIFRWRKDEISDLARTQFVFVGVLIDFPVHEVFNGRDDVEPTPISSYLVPKESHHRPGFSVILVQHCGVW
jgi:hypothetical protein